VFSNLTGLDIEQFKFLFNSIQNEITLYNQSKFKTKADLLLSYLMYLRTNICSIFLGYLFNLKESNICLNFKKLENKISSIMKKEMEKAKIQIVNDMSLNKDKILELITDVTECEIKKPKDKDKRQRVYSGKKKKCTKKKEIIITQDKMIIVISSNIIAQFMEAIFS